MIRSPDDSRSPTDHGCQFRKKFHAAMKKTDLRHVRGKVRAPFLNGKCERYFRTFRIWWRLVLCGRSAASVQRRINDHVFWYNGFRPHSALGILTPNEAWNAQAGRNADTPVCALRGQDCPRYRPPRRHPHPAAQRRHQSQSAPATRRNSILQSPARSAAAIRACRWSKSRFAKQPSLPAVSASNRRLPKVSSLVNEPRRARSARRQEKNACHLLFIMIYSLLIIMANFRFFR